MKQTKKTQNLAAVTAAVALLAGMSHDVNAGLEPFIGEISYVGFNFAPNGWMQCNGQLLSISQYSALFSLLGTTYGGNGQTNFALPDLRGKVAIHQGQSPGGSTFTIGESAGFENITLTIGNMPAHTHPATATSTSTSTVNAGATATSTLKAASSEPATNTAQGNSLPTGSRGTALYSTSAPSVSMNAASIETTLSGIGITTTTNTNVIVGIAGGSQPFSIMQPYTVVNCIIATEGVYPSRP
jgi:microcystin-dependent protein